MAIFIGAVLWIAAALVWWPAADAVLMLYCLWCIRHWLQAFKGEPQPPENLPDVIVNEKGELYERKVGNENR